MDLENGDHAPNTPEVQPSPEPEYSPTSPEPDDEMDTGMIGLLKTRSGREDIKEKVKKDSEEIMRLIRDLGGDVPAYKRERNKDVNRIVAEIYSAPRVTRLIKMMPSSNVV